MGWEATSAAVTLTMLNPSTPKVSAVFQFNPGESCSIELLRTDAGSDEWTWAILEGVENDVTKLSDLASPRRQVLSTTLRVVFPHDSLGSRFFAIEIDNADNVSPSDSVIADLRITFDGVDLSA